MRHGDHLPQSEAETSAYSDVVGGPIQGIIEIKKAYDTLDQERCLEIIVAHGSGSRMEHLLRK